MPPKNYRGTSVTLCFAAPSAAASENGIPNVVPVYQAFHWSMNHGLAGSIDSPSTTFSVERSRSPKSTVSRSDGPKLRPTCFTVTRFPLWACGRGPPKDRVLDLHRVHRPIPPPAQVLQRPLLFEPRLHRRRQQLVPVRIPRRQPPPRLVHDDLLLRVPAESRGPAT